MALQIEYVNDALPNYRTSVRFFDGHGLGKRGRATVLGFDSVLKGDDGYFCHWNRHAAAANSAI